MAPKILNQEESNEIEMESENDNIVKCHSCLESYNNHDHKPFGLPCNHNICPETLQQWKPDSLFIQCTLCKGDNFQKNNITKNTDLIKQIVLTQKLNSTLKQNQKVTNNLKQQLEKVQLEQKKQKQKEIEKYQQSKKNAVKLTKETYNIMNSLKEKYLQIGIFINNYLTKMKNEQDEILNQTQDCFKIWQQVQQIQNNEAIAKPKLLIIEKDMNSLLKFIANFKKELGLPKQTTLPNDNSCILKGKNKNTNNLKRSSKNNLSVNSRKSRSRSRSRNRRSKSRTSGQISEECKNYIIKCLKKHKDDGLIISQRTYGNYWKLIKNYNQDVCRQKFNLTTKIYFKKYYKNQNKKIRLLCGVKVRMTFMSLFQIFNDFR